MLESAASAPHSLLGLCVHWHLCLCLTRFRERWHLSLHLTISCPASLPPSFLIDTTSLGLTVILGIHTVTFGLFYFRLSCVQLFIQQIWWIFSFSEILPSHISLSLQQGTLKPQGSIWPICIQGSKREKNKMCVCFFFLSHTPVNRKTNLFSCATLSHLSNGLRYFIWQSVVFARGFEQIFNLKY